MAKKFSIQIVVHNEPFPIKTTYGKIRGKTASRKELRDYIPLFLFEFNLYPTDLVKKTGLKRIILCKELSFQHQRRNALPDFEHDTLYLDVARGHYSEWYMRKVIHHEFFHIIDWRDDRKLYKDDRWATLNPKGFAYGTGGRYAQDDSTVSLINDTIPGFLNKYSTTGVEEDKAEIFANMMVHNWKTLQKRAKRDKVIAHKIVQMEQLLNRFSPAVDRGFWNKIRKLRRSKETGRVSRSKRRENQSENGKRKSRVRL